MVEIPELAVVPEETSFDVVGGEVTITLKNQSSFPNQPEFYGDAGVVMKVDVDGSTVATADRQLDLNVNGGTDSITLTWGGATNQPQSVIARAAIIYVYDGSRFQTPEYDLTGDDPPLPWLRAPILVSDVACQTSADEVSPGDTFTVEASVDNTISIEQTYPVRLEILNTVMYQKVTIGGGGTEFVSFDITVPDNAQDGTTYNPSVSVPVVLDEDHPIATP